MQKLNKIIKYFSINSSRSMDWKKLVIIAILLFFASCISFYPHPKGGFRPKKPNFSLAKEKFKYNKLIDTMAIYTNIDTIKYPSFKSVFYLKFFNDGCFFMSRKDDKDYVTQNNLKPGLIGYYLLKKDRVFIEYYSIDPLNKYNTEYIKQNGFIKNDTIFLKNDVDTTYIETYIKQKLDFIPEPSNW